MKVKDWAYDEAEKAVDKIIVEYNNGIMSKESAMAEILQVSNVDMLGIDENNVGEVF